LVFGVYPNGRVQTVTSTAALMDSRWHHVVASIGPAGMQLVVDGVLTATNPSVTKAAIYTGFWRIGGETLTWWPDAPSNPQITGELSALSLYTSQLPTSAAIAHYKAGYQAHA